MISQDFVPALPSGYSWVRSEDGVLEVPVWTVSSLGRGLQFLSQTSVQRFLDTDEDGNVVWKDSAGRTEMLYPENIPVVFEFIPDSEIPEGGMTPYHTHFNEATKKWELPDIEHIVHAEHERGHDSDVASAVAEVCDVSIKLMLREALLANLNPDETARAEAKLTGFDDCIDNIVEANAEPAIERAWLQSLGEIRHTGESAPERQFIQRAHAFANAYIAMIDAKTTTQLRARKYEYTLCLRQQLLADRGKTSGRFLPKGAALVKTASSPKVATEVTEEQLFTKLRNLISPTEGPAKS